MADTDSWDQQADEQDEAVEREYSEADLARQYMSVWILLASGLLGLVGNVFFYKQGFGINIVLYVALFLSIGIGLLRLLERPIARLNVTFVVPALIFAAFLGIRSTPILILWNAILVAGSLFLVLRYATTTAFIGGSWYTPIVDAMESSILVWLDGPFNVVPSSVEWFQQRNWKTEQYETFRAVLRGLVLTLPVLILFGVMLSSADVVFGDFLEGSFSWLTLDDPQGVVTQVFIVGFFTWICMAGYKLMVIGPFTGGTARPELRSLDTTKGHRRNFQLGMIETSMVLASTDVLFTMFVLVQTRYFFGGEANITAQGYTYSEYARRGFIELLAVSIMTMGLVLALDFLTHRNDKQERLFRLLTITMVGLTMVLLVAAFQRLSLYEDAFGFTRLRVMTQVFMVWLGVLFIVLIAAIISQNKRDFWIAAAVVSLSFVATLNAMNMDGFIASRNIQRFDDTGKLDADYLLSLSDDAIPAIVTILEDDIGDEEWYAMLINGLRDRLMELDADRDERGVFGYHVSKARAWNALDEYRDLLTGDRDEAGRIVG